MLSSSEVTIPVIGVTRLKPLIGQDRFDVLIQTAKETRSLLRGRTVWNLNSTASGGGVAEMLRVLCAYIRSLDVDTRWLVIEGDTEFFAITKRVHNRIHGFPGDNGTLGEHEQNRYESVLEANAESFLGQVRAGDVVILHDPQTAGLAAKISVLGTKVVWRCHIGSESTNGWTDEAWRFLRPHLRSCDAFVFSKRTYVPGWIPDDKVVVIPPSIDPFSPKNQELSEETVLSILGRAGIVTAASDDGAGSFTKWDGSVGSITRTATVVTDLRAPDSSTPLVVQVSRWDHLKDMRGVLEGFASGVVPRTDADLALVGPAVSGVSDDPEGPQVLNECVAAWETLPSSVRKRIQLVTLPTDDIDENAAIVNALQRHATVIVQKSLAEGFGLTVAEGMWKAKPVVASAVGGIVDQIEPGTGILLDDPKDLERFGEILAGLLQRPADIADMGARARNHVLEGFVGDLHLLRYADLIKLLART